MLSVLFAALEYTSTWNGESIDEELLEGLSAEMESAPMLDTRRYVTVSPVLSGRVSADKLKVVENAVADPQESCGEGDEPLEDVSAVEAVAEENEVPETDASLSEPDADDRPRDFRVVEQLPEFPGGMEAFVQWLTTNLKYPRAARDRKTEGKVVVSFIINRDGSIADVKVAKAVDPLLDREALRVVRMMPKWKPGLEKRQAVPHNVCHTDSF